MYVPKDYKFENLDEQLAFMRRYSFATIITTIDNLPHATHLPFIINRCGDRVVLISHLSIANPQAKNIDNNTSLIIFNQPHSYISPTLYNKEQEVPTWDYIAVHAYGKGILLEQPSDKLRVLEATMKFYEQDYLKQWSILSEKYKNNLLKGMIAFEIEVTKLQGQKKISQDKTLVEQQRIACHLATTSDSTQTDLSNYIIQQIKSK